jgi:protein-export membrane protein SecD
MKKAISAALVVLILLGWYVSLFGLGSIKPIRDQLKLGLDLKGGVYVVMEAETNVQGETLKQLMTQTQSVIERRVNAMGLSEPIVTIEGEKRIRVELPGASNAEEAIAAIGKTAQLEFVMADGTKILDGSQVADAGVQVDQQNGGYAVTLKFTATGSTAFKDATAKIVNGEMKTTTTEKYGTVQGNIIMIILDDAIISAPGVSEVIPNGEAIITSGRGGFGQEEATTLGILIRGGALPVALKEVQTSIVGPTLGLDAFNNSVIAGGIGILLIMIFMLLMYRIMGFAANIALLMYILLVMWVIIALGAVLTLPGIAGIILSVGMAVDANVIIFARIQEETLNGKSIRVATDQGFKRAMTTIIDSNSTTIIAALVLYQFGSGPVKGFAATLMIGIIASMFTALIVTHSFLGTIIETKRFTTRKWFAIKEDSKNV